MLAVKTAQKNNSNLFPKNSAQIDERQRIRRPPDDHSLVHLIHLTVDELRRNCLNNPVFDLIIGDLQQDQSNRNPKIEAGEDAESSKKKKKLGFFGIRRGILWWDCRGSRGNRRSPDQPASPTSSWLRNPHEQGLYMWPPARGQPYERVSERGNSGDRTIAFQQGWVRRVEFQVGVKPLSEEDPQQFVHQCVLRILL